MAPNSRRYPNFIPHFLPERVIHGSGLPSRILLQLGTRQQSSGWQRYVAGELTFAEQRTWRVEQVLAMQQESGAESQPLTAQDVLDIFARYLTLYEESWTLYPDALPCLEALSAYPLGVITNGDGESAAPKAPTDGHCGMLPFGRNLRARSVWRSRSGRYSIAVLWSWACYPANSSSSAITRRLTFRALCRPVGRVSG